METMKVLVDVEPTDAPMNRQDAIKAAKQVATDEAKRNGIKVASVEALYSRIDPSRTFWQVVTQVKEADFPPKDDEGSPEEEATETPDEEKSEDSDKPKGDGDSLPDKLHDVIDEHAAGEDDAKGKLAEALSGLMDQLQSIVEELGGGEPKDDSDDSEDSGDPADDADPVAPDGPNVDFMPGGGPAGPRGLPGPPTGRPKPPMMSASLPKAGVSYEEAFESAKELPKHDPALKGLKLASLDTDRTSYTARFSR